MAWRHSTMASSMRPQDSSAKDRMQRAISSSGTARTAASARRNARSMCLGADGSAPKATLIEMAIDESAHGSRIVGSDHDGLVGKLDRRRQRLAGHLEILRESLVDQPSHFGRAGGALVADLPVRELQLDAHRHHHRLGDPVLEGQRVPPSGRRSAEPRRCGRLQRRRAGCSPLSRRAPVWTLPLRT